MLAVELLLMAPPLPSPVPVAGPTASLSVNALLVTVREGPSLSMAPPAEPSVMGPVMERRSRRRRPGCS